MAPAGAIGSRAQAAKPEPCAPPTPVRRACPADCARAAGAKAVAGDDDDAAAAAPEARPVRLPARPSPARAEPRSARGVPVQRQAPSAAGVRGTAETCALAMQAVATRAKPADQPPGTQPGRRRAPRADRPGQSRGRSLPTDARKAGQASGPRGAPKVDLTDDRVIAAMGDQPPGPRDEEPPAAMDARTDARREAVPRPLSVRWLPKEPRVPDRDVPAAGQAQMPVAHREAMLRLVPVQTHDGSSAAGQADFRRFRRARKPTGVPPRVQRVRVGKQRAACAARSFRPALASPRPPRRGRSKIRGCARTKRMPPRMLPRRHRRC